MTDAHEFFRTAWDHLKARFGVGRFSTLVGRETLSVSVPHPDWVASLGDGLVSTAPWSERACLEVQVFCRKDLDTMPDFPIALDRQSVQGRIDPWCSPDFLAIASEYGMVFADKSVNRALLYYEDLHSIPIWDQCAPFRTVIGFFSSALNAQLVHGAAVAVDGMACLLCGQGGSGKSSTAIVATESESSLQFLSEDYTLVGTDLEVYPLYRSLKIDSRGLERMPWLADFTVLGQQEGKTCYFCPADRLAPATKLAAIVWPDRRSAQPVTPLGTMAALKHLAPSTLFQNPAASRDDFAALVTLCRSRPSFKLGLGDSPNATEVEARLTQLTREALQTK